MNSKNFEIVNRDYYLYLLFSYLILQFYNKYMIL